MKCKQCKFYDAYINNQKHAIEYCKRRGQEIKEIDDVEKCEKYVDVNCMNYYRRDILTEI